MASIQSTGRTAVRTKETKPTVIAVPTDKTPTNVERSSVESKENVKIERDQPVTLTARTKTDLQVAFKVESHADTNLIGKTKGPVKDPLQMRKKEEEKVVEEEEDEEKVENISGSKDPVTEELTAKDQLELPVAPTCKPSRIPIHQKPDPNRPVNVAVPRKRAPFPSPALNERPLVLATHLVPSLPIGLFEVLAEVIEVATRKPVVLLYEPRTDRPVAKDVVDIAVLPASENWNNGDLLPLSFVFAHRLNKDESPSVYADVVLASDRASHVENILDLRGQRCALPDRQKSVGAATLLMEYLCIKGEGPAFFGNTLDSGSQLAALQMVAGKQAEVGIIEAPVITYHKKYLPGVESLHILSSLGPLPPYPIMVNKMLPETIRDQITTYLLNIKENEDWIEKLSPYGIINFAKNSPEFYTIDETKPVVTSAPYY